MRYKRQSKIKYPAKTVALLVEKDCIRYAKHAVERMFERNITQLDITHVLTKGWYVPLRDKWTEKDGWSYCFEGFTDEQHKVRVAVVIGGNLLIITVVRL